MARLSLQDSLKQSPVFSALSDEALVQIIQQSLRRVAAAETLLFSEGEPCQEILLILRGKVRLWRQSKPGQLMILHRCSEGDILGQMSVLTNAPHSVNATTDEECELWRVQASVFRELLIKSPEALLRLAIILSERVRDLSSELEELKFLSVQERVGRKLKALGKGRRELKLTHESLAQEIGASRENVSRALATFTEQGAIALRRGTIVLLDLSIL
jgi:CRP-like cAMP-binding protein